MRKTIVITGASDGIGVAGARRLLGAGHEVVLVGRSPEKTESVAKELDADFFVSDFAVLDQVRSLATAIDDRYPVVDVLINNAGGIFGERSVTVDGFERTLQVNHLAPFLLTNALLPKLVASRATVVNTSSVAARLFGRLDTDDLNNDKNFTARRAYGNAKLANILFTRELAKRFGESGLNAVAFHPGNVATNFAAGAKGPMKFLYQTRLGRKIGGLITPEEGASNMVWLATSEPGTDWVSGEYYEKSVEATTNKQADDAALANWLWQRSAAFVGLESTSREDWR